MKFTITLLSFVLGQAIFYAQNLNASELLNNAIAYHDPTGQWSAFNDSLKVTMTTPKSADRVSDIYINLPQQFFSVSASRGENTSFYKIDKGQCSMSYNGEVITDETAGDSGMSCDRASLYKNYYTYLYGLPMKLKDPGTNINHPVEKKQFKGKEYLVLKATYDEAVGSDIWYFYFNPKTYAMEVYQFFKTDENGQMLPESGEYILLEDLSEISSIKLPKIRHWHYNKDDGFLGTDTLSNL